MKGDFTRWTFRPEKHYHSVLKEQGRVDLDADWNEEGAIVSHRVETETIDVVGPSGAPVGDAGFVLSPSGGGANLSISAGRAYVDGILCENDQPVLITAQPDLPGFKLPTTAGNYIAYLEVWLRHITALDDAGIQRSGAGRARYLHPRQDRLAGGIASGEAGRHCLFHGGAGMDRPDRRQHRHARRPGSA